MIELILSAAEARVIASMVEKAITTPQYYPMTVNAIMLASNQKSSRYPAMALTEGEVGAALIRLEERVLVKRDDSSGRAVKWRHQFQHQLLLKPQGLAVLATLMLRGPQTLAELRANAAALGGPSVETLPAVLEDLIDRAQPLVTVLPRGPGQAAQRYAHLLCGPVDTSSLEAPAAGSSSTLLERVEALEARVAELEARLSAAGG